MNTEEKALGAMPNAESTSWRKIALFLLTLCGVVTCALFVKTLLFAITFAVTLAVVTAPLTRWLRRRMSGAWTATAMVVLVSMALVLPLTFLLQSLLGEAVSTVRFVQSGQATAMLDRVIQNHPKVGGVMQRGLEQLAGMDLGRSAAGTLAGKLGGAVSGVAKGLTNVALMLFLYFFAVRDSDAALKATKQMLPMHAGDAEELLGRLGEVMEAIFAGRFIIAVIQGVLAGIAYRVLGVPGSLLWGSITVVCCLVPAFGAYVGWVPVALYLGLAESWTKAGVLAVWGAAVVGNIDNVLYPMMVGRKTDLSTPVIFAALFGGLAIFGISGFVLGPVIVAATMLLLTIWKRRVGQPVQA